MKLRNTLYSFVAAGLFALPATVSAQTSCVNAFEPNNSTAQPAYLPLNQQIDAGITSTTDVDFYRLDVPGDGVISLTLANLTADFDLVLFNSSGVQLASSAAGGSTYESILYSVPAGSATYYVKVFGYNGATSTTCYRLLNTFNKTSTSDIYESNETQATAKNIGVNTNIDGKISSSTDNDWFKFTTNSPNTNLQIFLSGLQSDFDIQLVDGAGNVIGSSTAGAGRNEVLVYNTTVAGVYYLHVYGFNGANSNLAYVLKVNLNSATFAGRSGQATGGDKFDNLAKEDVTSLNGVNFYPNPALSGEEVSVYMAGQEGLTQVRILNSTGELVSAQKVTVSSGMAKVSLAGIKPGMYLLDAGDAGVHKLVVK